MWKSWREKRQLKRALAAISGHSNGTTWLLVPFVPVLLLVAYVESLPPRKPSHVDPIFWGILAVLMASVFLFYRVERYRALRLLDWLREHRDALQRGRDAELTFAGHRLSGTSELVQYQICVSMFVLYAEFKTSYYVRGHSTSMKIVSSVLVFLFGWWSLFGPFITVRNLVVNLRGGVSVSVQDLLARIPA